MANEGWSIDPQNPNRAVYTDAEGTVLQEAFKDEAVAQPETKPTVKNKKVNVTPAPATAPVTGASRVQPTMRAPVATTPGAGEEAKFWDEAPSDVNTPRRLTKEQEAAYKEFEQLHNGNPNFSQADIDEYWKAQGFPGGLPASNEYIDAIRKGGDVGNINYSQWDEQQAAERKAAAEAYGKGIDPEQGRFMREYNEAVQYGFPGLIGRWGNDWMDAGKEELKKQFPGQTDEWYEQQSDKVIREGQRAIRDFYAAQSEKDPTWRPDESTFANIASGRWIPSVTAAVLGSVGPESALMPGGTAAARIGGQAGISGAAELGYELADKAEGVSDEVSATNILAAGALGGLFQGGIELGGALVSRARTSPADEIAEAAGDPISSEEFQALGQKLGVATDQEMLELTPGQMAPEQVRSFIEDPETPAPTPGAPEAMSDRMLMERGELPPADVTVRNDNPTAPARIDVEEKVAELTKDWKNSPEFEIVERVDDIVDPNIRAAVDDPSIVGFYGPDGKVRIIANNLSSVDDVKPAIFHESLGHHGMRQKFGDELDNFMTRLHKNSPELRAAVDEWNAANKEDYGNIPLATQVEEVLAGMSEEGALSRTIIDRVKDWLKNFARKRMGMDLEFSPREVKSILAQAHQMVTEGADTGARGDGMRFIKAFHVSPNNFDKFDRRYRGKGEGAQAYGQGHYFTESPDVD
jgi:hypothetical protein